LVASNNQEKRKKPPHLQNKQDRLSNSSQDNQKENLEEQFSPKQNLKKIKNDFEEKIFNKL